VQYVNSDNTKPTFTAQGLMNKKDMVPETLYVTSSAAQQSALWVGRFGSLEVKMVFQLESSALYHTTSVVIKNVATTPITELFRKFESPGATLPSTKSTSFSLQIRARLTRTWNTTFTARKRR
jgi:hypothetical protein